MAKFLFIFIFLFCCSALQAKGFLSLDSNAVVGDSASITVAHDTLISSKPFQLARPGIFDWVTNLPSDWWKWSKQTFTVKQLPLIAGLTAVTAATIITDYETWQATKDPYDHNKYFGAMCNIGEGIGDGKTQFGIAGAYLLYGFIANDDRSVRTASQIVEVILSTGGVVQLLKHTTGRESPFLATSRTGKWIFFPNQIDYLKHTPKYDAFPSGHIATAMATLTVIMENYPEKKWIPYIGYPLIAVTATGLVGTSIHWWSDIPLGIAIGYSFGRLVSHPEDNTSAEASSGTSLGMTVMPDGGAGLSLTMNW